MTYPRPEGPGGHLVERGAGLEEEAAGGEVPPRGGQVQGGVPWLGFHKKFQFWSPSKK